MEKLANLDGLATVMISCASLQIPRGKDTFLVFVSQTYPPR